MNKRTVLVTGGGGFIGSHLCERLLAEGMDVICLDNFFTGSKNNIRHLLVNPSFELIQASSTSSTWPSTTPCPRTPPTTGSSCSPGPSATWSGRRSTTEALSASPITAGCWWGRLPPRTGSSLCCGPISASGCRRRPFSSTTKPTGRDCSTPGGSGRSAPWTGWTWTAPARRRPSARPSGGSSTPPSPSPTGTTQNCSRPTCPSGSGAT